ncbi:MAG: hypothetical protein K2M10_05210, partial [Muribaculaceae bacterium]|nr:hypothetical protein [Muribaculaceae bacterium]
MIFRKQSSRYILKRLSVPLLALTIVVLSLGQYRKSELLPPPPTLPSTNIPDSVILPSPVQTTLPRDYAAEMAREYVADLTTPSN